MFFTFGCICAFSNDTAVIKDSDDDGDDKHDVDDFDGILTTTEKP